MFEFICVRCGSSVQGDMAVSDVCGNCSATAIATQEDAHQAKVTPSAPSDGVSIQGLRMPERYPLSFADDAPPPSILREYHYSFLRICVYNLIWTAALIACFVFWLMVS